MVTHAYLTFRLIISVQSCSLSCAALCLLYNEAISRQRRRCTRSRSVRRHSRRAQLQKRRFLHTFPSNLICPSAQPSLSNHHRYWPSRVLITIPTGCRVSVDRSYPSLGNAIKMLSDRIRILVLLLTYCSTWKPVSSHLPLVPKVNLFSNPISLAV